jgi:hypothetical protein
MKIFSQTSQCPNWDLNQAPHEYKPGAWSLESACMILNSISLDPDWLMDNKNGIHKYSKK